MEYTDKTVEGLKKKLEGDGIGWELYRSLSSPAYAVELGAAFCDMGDATNPDGTEMRIENADDNPMNGLVLLFWKDVNGVWHEWTTFPVYV